MLPLLAFLRQAEFFLYAALVLLSLRYFVAIFRVQVKLRKTMFALEREILLRMQNGAAAMLGVLALGVVGVFLAVHVLLPEAVKFESRRAAEGPGTPTAVPTATPFIVFDVDIGGCQNPHAQIVSPKPGDTVSGKVTIRGTADVNAFAYYSLELERPDVANIWVTLFTRNTMVTEKNGVLYEWDSSTLPPGVYHLRLIVMLQDGSYPQPCVVPIQVLS